MRDGWHRFRTMPDRERARFLSLVFGAIIVGILYALGGISLYLRASFLPPSATASSAGSGVTLTPVAPLIIITPTKAITPTLYPTITPTLEVAQAPAMMSETQVPTETPFPSPTAQPTQTPGPTEEQPAPTAEIEPTLVMPARPGR